MNETSKIESSGSEEEYDQVIWEFSFKESNSWPWVLLQSVNYELISSRNHKKERKILMFWQFRGPFPKGLLKS